MRACGSPTTCVRASRRRSALQGVQTPEGLAYRTGLPAALDRILLGRAFEVQDVSRLEGWESPRLPLSGGDLIAMGLKAGPRWRRRCRKSNGSGLRQDFLARPRPAPWRIEILVSLLRATQ